MTRLLFATDLHGNTSAYDALLDRAVGEGADAVVLGGDLLPLPSPGENALAEQQVYVEERLSPRLRAFHRDHSSIRVFGLPGNDDWAAAWDPLEKLEPDGAFFPLHLRAHRLDDAHWIAGYSCVPLTPFFMSDWDRFDARDWVPRDEPRRVFLSGPDGLRQSTVSEIRSRPPIEEDLRKLGGLSEPGKTVYVIHTPPWQTKLDLMHGGFSIGSRAVREFIEERQPPLTLHGHIHESPHLSGSISDELGATLSVNPGDSRTKLRTAWIDLEDPAGTLRLVE